MKKKILTFLVMTLCISVLQGCSVSFSTGGIGRKKDTSATSNMVDAVSTGTIEMEDMTLTLPEGMKYGTQDTDTGKVYYVWGTDAEQVSPADENIILYVYEGNDISSPDKELTNQEARLSIQSYIQIFRDSLDAKINSDPDVTENSGWYTFQFTGYSGNYETTSYGTMCYPKYYYGVYTLECLTDDYNRNFYGFIFSNDSTGEVMGESDYNFIFNQIKKSFSITEFYTLPQLEYDAAKDYSDGYNYDQLLQVFADVHNYYGMQENKIDYRGPYEFVCVEKDNTITVNDGTISMKVKLIGVDIPVISPESEDSENAAFPESEGEDSENAAEGQEAVEYMKQQLEGKKIYLECDKREKDDNGYILAYVYLDDRTTMLNKMVVEKGFAKCVPTEPNIKYSEEFAILENEAKKNGEGFWGTEVFRQEEGKE